MYVLMSDCSCLVYQVRTEIEYFVLCLTFIIFIYSNNGMYCTCVKHILKSNRPKNYYLTIKSWIFLAIYLSVCRNCRMLDIFWSQKVCEGLKSCPESTFVWLLESRYIIHMYMPITSYIYISQTFRALLPKDTGKGAATTFNP